METLSIILMYLCGSGLVYTYVIYPALVKNLHAHSKKRFYSGIELEESSDLPIVGILLAAHNEELVIKNKIISSFTSTYPAHLIKLYVGTDNCSDQTVQIVESLLDAYPERLTHLPNEKRLGKPQTINGLADVAINDGCEVLALTDANVFFTPPTLMELVSPMVTHPQVALVEGHIRNVRVKRDGISLQERTYLEGENALKYGEGELWGSLMGAFGGCYAIQASAYTPVPKGYLVDDFFITLSMLVKGGKAIHVPLALCYDDIGNEAKEEFRRKVRIATGNFQNLTHFLHHLSPFTTLGFVFWSHKGLRWIGPFLLLGLLFWSMISALLYQQELSALLVLAQIILLLSIPLNFLAKSVGVHLYYLRLISHFYHMNGALLVGFFKFLKGGTSGVWQPTARNQ